MEKRTQFPVGWLPYALVAPQLAITIVFFIWPAAQALWQSLLVQDAFGINTEFVWFENFQVLFADDTYVESFKVTALFSVLVATLGLGIALVLAVSAWQMSRRGGDVVPVEGPRMPSTYYDPALGRQVSYGVHGLGLGFTLSFVAGNVSGLLGVGGGAFKVPIMNLLMGVPLKATIATSNLMIGVTAATSAAIFYGRGYVDPRWAVPAALGILVGARIGPRFAIHLPARVLVLVFEVVLVVFGVLMLLKALGVGV